jgi:L-gulono-1,4-lactone dehydrogenase
MTETGGTWHNWAANQRCVPAVVAHPSGTEEIAAVVKQATAAGRGVKVVGSGHSFTDIACTTGTLIQLDRHTRLLGLDRDTGQVTVQSGIGLSALNEALATYGLAMPNLGDIEYQTVSGALSTGTHGTGSKLGCLATTIVAMELVTGDGSVAMLSADEDPAGLAAARVGLGALGVISSLTLQCVPAFNLRAEEGPARLDEIIESFDELADGNDHFEFYWIPRSRYVLTKRNNRVDGPRVPRSKAKEWVDDVVLSNWVFGTLGRMQARRPQLARRINKLLPKAAPLDYVDRSDKVFTSPRTFKFYEMEYGFPRSAAVEVLREVRSFVEKSGLPIGMPLEVRVAAGDDIPLSMASGRDSCFIAVHVFQGQQYDQYFRAVESIMNNVAGRPHWGKLHYQSASSLSGRYPRWSEFAEARRRFDPEGRFANAYTERVLGPVGW